MKIRNRHLAVALVLAGIAVSGCSQQPAMVEPVAAMPAPGYVPEAEPEMQQQPQPEQWAEVQQQPPMVEPVQQQARIVVPRPKMPARVIVVPKTKAKGTYRGAVPIDRSAVQQYQY